MPRSIPTTPNKVRGPATAPRGCLPCANASANSNVRLKRPEQAARGMDAMKLYGEANPAPNPRRVRLFAAEKGLDLPEIRVGMRQGGHKSPEHKARNSLGQVPVLELDDGETISE